MATATLEGYRQRVDAWCADHTGTMKVDWMVEAQNTAAALEALLMRLDQEPAPGHMGPAISGAGQAGGA
jgi:hypothetical protein